MKKSRLRSLIELLLHWERIFPDVTLEKVLVQCERTYYTSWGRISPEVVFGILCPKFTIFSYKELLVLKT